LAILVQLIPASDKKVFVLEAGLINHSIACRGRLLQEGIQIFEI
jgi:hypothetical protein